MFSTRFPTRTLILALALLAGTVRLGAEERLEVFPAAIELVGPRASAQIVVTHIADDRPASDVTAEATIESADAALLAIAAGRITPRGEGKTELVVRHKSREVRVPVTIRGLQSPPQISFVREVVPALTKHQCSGGACHGSPSGKGGFRLSLWGFDPDLDRKTLTREELGRRVNPFTPAESLLLMKPAMRVAHAGGLRIRPSVPAWPLLVDWIGGNCPIDIGNAPAIKKLEIYPATTRVLRLPEARQQMAVLAHFANGSIRDVTSLAAYSTSDEEVAVVDASGKISGKRRGVAAIGVRYLGLMETASLTVVQESPGFVFQAEPARNFVDEKIDAQLRALQLLPAPATDDAGFHRRAWLDLIGQLADVEATRKFLADPAPDKRAKLVDRLLANPDHARYWAQRWADLLRVNKGAAGETGVYKYHRWIERSLAENMPYDRFAREILLASGNTLRQPPASFYRAAADNNETIEQVMQVFCGARLQCAKCHNHPFERWTQDQYFGLGAFFARVQKKAIPNSEEVVVRLAETSDWRSPRSGKSAAWLPGQESVAMVAGTDPRGPFVDWLARPENPYFARVEVNRIWGFLFGEGLIEPIDDVRDTNPPANATLLDALAADFAAHRFDRRHVIRTIMASRTYQSRSKPALPERDDPRYATRYRPRLLAAEPLLDALGAAIGAPEKFEALPSDMRAVALPSPDLAPHELLKAFGQPERSSVCACERPKEVTLAQGLQILNGGTLHRMLKDPEARFRKLLVAKKSDREIAEELWLAALGRLPTEAEWKTATDYLAAATDRTAGWEDIQWALVNREEFLMQH